MHLNTDTEINDVDRDKILHLLSLAHYSVPPESTLQQLTSELAQIQRTRHVAIWHDHSSILKTGYILFALWVVYNPAVFLTESECSNIQEYVEQPVIYMIVPSSSSPSDQIAILGDRMECLHEMSSAVTAHNGVSLTDRLWL